jgi:glycosyltransferase involved in cell wall biosynthesis
MTASIPRAPTVSVVMAVKNGGQIMREAIDSILNQTFTDFEFIIINDGSTDETLEVLAEYKDPRIQVYSQENQGVARSANRGLAIARGKYIARQDHDDISLPARLQKQVEYLESHPECGLLGTAAEIWSSSGPTGRYHDHPTNSSLLKFELIFNNPFVHTSVMFRRNIIKVVGLYDPRVLITPLDDYQFISRVARSYPVSNLAERLVIYRENHNSLTSSLRNNSETHLQQKLGFISGQNLAYYSSDILKKHSKKMARLYHYDNSSRITFRDIKLFNNEIRKIGEKILIIKDTEVVCQAINSKIAHIRFRALEDPGSVGYITKVVVRGYEFFQEILYKTKTNLRKALSKLKKLVLFRR